MRNDVEKVRRNMEESVTKMSDEIQHLNRDVTVRMKNVVRYWRNRLKRQGEI